MANANSNIYIIYYPIGFYVIDTFVLIAHNNLDRINKVEAETLEIFWQISYRLFDSLSKLISSVYYVSSKRQKSYRNTKMDFIRWWYPMQTIHLYCSMKHRYKFEFAWIQKRNFHFLIIEWHTVDNISAQSK